MSQSRATVPLLAAAMGGTVAGALADRVGRVRVLILSIGVYGPCTLLAGFAQSYEQLLVLRTLQGLGVGGEWAVGAVLAAKVGLGDAIDISATTYALCLVALLFLPETSDSRLTETESEPAPSA